MQHNTIDKQTMPTGLTTLPAPELIDVTHLAPKDPWSNPSSRGLLHNLLIKWKWLRVLCCVDDSLLEEVQLECTTRDAVRRELMCHLEGYNQDSVVETMRDVYAETGYDLSNFRAQAAEKEERERKQRLVQLLTELRAAEEKLQKELSDYAQMWFPVSLERHTQSEWNNIANNYNRGLESITRPAVSNMDRLRAHIREIDPTHEAVRSQPSRVVVPEESQPAPSIIESGHQAVVPPQAEPAPKPAAPRALIVPRFTAALVVALRAKFGRLPINEANRLLIEREYLKVCRDMNVRHVDIEYHRQFVINAYFNESVTDHLATVRVRLPRWLRSAFGFTPYAGPTVC